MTEGTESSYYVILRQKLGRRTREPLRHPSFVIYLLVAVFGFGGLGLWIELYRYVNAPPEAKASLDAARVAMMTLFPALVGSTALQAIWAESERDFRSFAVLVLAVSVLMAVIVGPMSSVSNGAALLLGAMAWIGALWFWIVTNADQQDFRDRISPSAPIGGDNPNVELPGNLDEYTH